MRSITAALVVSTAMLAATTGTSAAQTTITVSTWGSPNHGINTIVWPTWNEWIEEATDGRVTLDVVYDLGPPQSQMDLVADGVADASWIFHGHMPGRFQLTKLPEFPVFEAFSSETASAAYWRVHEEYLAQANEHRGLEVLGVGVHGPGQLFTKERITSLDQLEGLGTRVGGGVMSDVATALDIKGVAIPPTETYEALAQGVVDAAFFTPEALRSFRVGEVTDHTVYVPGGFYRGSFAIIVNPNTWSEISAEDREAIREVSGERLSRLFGYMMDYSDKRGYEFSEELGRTRHELDDAQIAELQERVDHLPQEWKQTVDSEFGIDGEAALDAFYEHLDELADTPSIEPETIRQTEN